MDEPTTRDTRIQCKDGDLALVTRDEPGLEANVGRLLWVYGPVIEHPEMGPVWETVPATDEPMAYIDPDGRVSFDRQGHLIIHPDAWMRPVRMDAFAGTRPPKPVTPVSLTREWLEAVANSGGQQVYLELPRKYDPNTPKITGEQLRLRLREELCIPIEEDYGCYAAWLWFPGRSLSATAHWWVSDAPPTLIGEVCEPADDEAHAIYYELEKDKALPWVFADGDWNTFMVLPARFEANLIPRFARATFDITEGRLVKSWRTRKGRWPFRMIRSDEQLLANWRISEAVAAASDPESFLAHLGPALRRQPHPLPALQA